MTNYSTQDIIRASNSHYGINPSGYHIRELSWSEDSLKRNCGYYVIKAFDYTSKRGIEYRVMLEKDNDKLTAIVSRNTSHHSACTAYPVECTKELAHLIREIWGENVSIFAERS